MTGEAQCAIGVPNVGPFGDPLLLVELAAAAEEHGWDGFFVWDHLLYHDQRWDVADPVAVIAAVAARTARIRIGVLVNVLENPGNTCQNFDNLFAGAADNPGGGECSWNVRNRNNQVVASGVYFYHIEAGDARRVGRFTVVNFAQ